MLLLASQNKMLDFHFLELRASAWKVWLSSLVYKTAEIEFTKQIARKEKCWGRDKNYVQVESWMPELWKLSRGFFQKKCFFKKLLLEQSLVKKVLVIHRSE